MAVNWARALASLTGPDDADRAVLVQPSSCDSRNSSPVAIRLAIWSVGLVSPRSTCESIGALTPERSARSRSDRSIASRSARTLDPTPFCAVSVGVIRMYVIAYGRRR